ncbi:MAG: hypothetical protein QW734_07815 [Candidatus Bathyarchaeia archaeon]
MIIKGDNEFLMLKKFYEPFLEYNVQISQISLNLSCIIGKNGSINEEIVTVGKGIPIFIPKKLFDKQYKIKEVTGFGFYHLYEIVKGNIVITKSNLKIKLPVFNYNSEMERNFLIIYFTVYKKMFRKIVKQSKESLKFFSSYRVKKVLEDFFSNI